MIDRMWNLYQDEKGLSVEEECDQYYRFFDQEVYVPSGWTGTMPNGDKIQSGSKFCDIRSKYKEDDDYQKVLDAYTNGENPTFNYHRFWGEAEIAIANGTYSVLLEEGAFPDIKETLLGDVNGDNKITILDSAMLQQYIRGNENVKMNEENSDINKDGVINVKDLLELKKLLISK